MIAPLALEHKWPLQLVLIRYLRRIVDLNAQRLVRIEVIKPFIHRWIVDGSLFFMRIYRM